MTLQGRGLVVRRPSYRWPVWESEQPWRDIEAAEDGECGYVWWLLGHPAVCVRRAWHQGQHCGWRYWAQAADETRQP